MKCQSCGHESKEEQPKFCSECGTRLFLPVPSKVNEAASTTSIGGVELSSISPNQLGDRKEVNSDTTKTAESNDQSKISKDELQLPLITNQEEINKKESEGGTGPPILSTVLSTGIEDSNTGKSDEDSNNCKIAEDSQPVSLMVETLTPSYLLAQDSDGKIIPKDQENESNVQETTITTPNNQFQHKHLGEKMVGMEEKSENSVQTDFADSKILTTTSCSIEGESVEEKQMTTNENNYDDNGKDKVEISTEDGVNYGTMSQSVNEEAKSNACKTSNLDYSSESLAQAFGTEHNNAAHVEKQTNILDKQELHNVTETRNENSSHKVKCKEECELETNLLSKNNKKDNSSSNQNRGNRDKDAVPNKETTSMNTPEAEPKRNMEQTSKKTFDVKDNENGKETVSINVTENVSKYVKKTKEPEQKVSSVVNAPKQQNVKTVASEKMRDNEEEQEPAVREIDPLNFITVYFHVIVSTNFEINPNEDNVVVKAGTLKGYQEWSDVVCEMTYTKVIRELGYLYEGRTQIAADSLDKYIPYKYVILKASTVEAYEYIHYDNVQDSKTINRCLNIQSKYVYNREWHQYDDVCMLKEKWIKKDLRSTWDKKYALQHIIGLKISAGEVMLRSIFSILDSCDNNNCLSLLKQLEQFYLLNVNPLLFGNRVIQWSDLGFGVHQVRLMLTHTLAEFCESIHHKKAHMDEDNKRRLIAGLICVFVMAYYSIPMEDKHLENICRALCIEEMPEEKMIEQIQKTKETFSGIPWMHSYLNNFCQHCINSDVDEWIWVLPVLHAFSQKPRHNPTVHNQEDSWAGLEGLAYNQKKPQRSGIVRQMIAKKYLVIADPKIIQSWLCLVPISSMLQFFETFPVKIIDALKACFFKFHEASLSQRQNVKAILTNLLQAIEQANENKVPSEHEFPACIRVGVNLHKKLCNNPSLQTCYELPPLSAQIILKLLYISGSLHQDKEATSHLTGQKDVFQEILKVTKQWLKDVYGNEFDENTSFNVELMAWDQILKADVTPEWKEALLPVLCRKIEQKSPVDRISMYCREQHKLRKIHPYINKCFEDCAINAVHLACQQNKNVLSSIDTSTLKEFSYLVSKIIENSWPKDNQGNHVKDIDGVLVHLLKWPDSTYIFKLYGADSKIKDRFEEDIHELVSVSKTVILEVIENVINREVLFQQMECILNHKEQFLAICNLQKAETLLLNDIHNILGQRESELCTLQQERAEVDSFLKMIQIINQSVKVNVSKIQKKHSEPLGPQSLSNIYPVEISDSSKDFTGHGRSYYDLCPRLRSMANKLYTFRKSHIFITCWEKLAQALSENYHRTEKSKAKDADDNEDNDDHNDLELTTDEIIDKLFIPCLEECKNIYNDLKTGQVSFEVVDTFLAGFKKNYRKLENELKILCNLGDMDNGSWISNCVKQIEQYHQLDVAFHSAKVIFNVKTLFKLNGDFKTLETLLEFSEDFEKYKHKPLSCISEEVVKTKKHLSEMTEEHIECLNEVLLRKDFCSWVKEALEDVNELKVFVDLASISAGENDLDVDRVACFHDAVLGYSPLLYDLKPDFGFEKLMECLNKLWKALKSDQNIPIKLRGSSSHIDWLKTVKESHGSVEFSSLSLATSINKNGIYIIRAPKNNKKITIDNVLQLQLPVTEQDAQKMRYYTLEDLKELLNKLMLMSGKRDQGNLEVVKFSEIFDKVQRLAGLLIDLYVAGNMLFRTWEAEIHCSNDAKVAICMRFNVDWIEKLEGRGLLTELLLDISNTIEKFLEEWVAFVNNIRSQLYFLNYYTAEQLVYLCQQYQKRDISEEALVMLSFIKPINANIDIINSCYSINESPWAQVDMMDFASQFENCTNVLEQLDLVWEFSKKYTSSFFPECLDLDTLGKRLAALDKLNNKTVERALHPSLEPNKPNLILCSPAEIWSCSTAVYMNSPNQPQPSYDEVLLCTPHTTFEEVALFLRRCMIPGYRGSKIYSLICADQLSYDVAYKSEQLYQQFQAQGWKSHNLVIICNSDREHCYIPSVFSQHKVHMIPQRPLQEIQHYMCTHFKVDLKVATAASVFKDGMSAGIVSSKRAGVGKSLYVKRLYQKLESRSPNKKPLLKIMRLTKSEVDENQVVEALLPFLQGKLKHCPTIFHIDITSSVTSGIAEFIFKLLFLQYLMGSGGRIWKRLPNHLYIIELLESSDNRNNFNSVNQLMQGSITDFFPKISCCSPKEVLTRKTENEVTDCCDPEMDMEEFHSEYIQRPYQYLIHFDQKENLDTFVYSEEHIEKDPAKCLQLFLMYCGIVDPSWSELRNFSWFLNIQLKDCESSVFCKHELVEDTLKGFKHFVVNFMILMAKDFATPSLNIADESPGSDTVNLDGAEESDLLPFLIRKRWESEPHPYVFFNEDHQSMTFLGFHLKRNITGSVDAINPRNNSIIQQNVMSSQLFSGLRAQRVPFNIDFNQLSRHDKISRLCMVLGIQWPMDPDETYELTMDNMLKILAIKMRFRCGIPVIIMGETGCGKTRLIKFLCQLCKGFVQAENLKLVKVHGGTTAEMIYRNILEAQDIARLNKEKGCETVLFFDEANSTEAISSIKEALCDRTVNGVPLEEDSGLHIIAACNPYRKHCDDMIKRLESAGLGYRVRADETKERLGSVPLRQLVYRVHALPPSMMPLVWDFGQLNNETENKYIQQMVQQLAKEIQLSDTKANLLANVLSASQSHMRKKKDECSFVSLRDVERCIQVLKWFYSHHEKLTRQYASIVENGLSSYSIADKMDWSLVLAVGVCYHASLEKKWAYRKAICKYFPEPYNNPDNILNEIIAIQDLFLAGVQLRDTIAKNLALKENVFMMVICIELKIPLFLVGKPGSSKSLAKTIVADAMQGQSSHTELYKDLKQIHLVSFQCSPHSTPEGIIGTFKHCARFQEKKDLSKYVSVVVLDEIGLAEDSPKMPLKTLHPLLEDGCIDDDTSPHKKVGFIGISNWALDPAKMNRGIFVSRDDPNEEELVNSAKGICSSESLILHEVQQHFPSFAKAYLNVCKTQKKQKKEFFGLRDFYSLIKMVFTFTKHSQDNLTLENIARAVLRNFSGKDEVNALESFLGNESRNIGLINTIDLVMENIKSDSDDCRYLLVLTKNYAALQILQQAFLKENQQPEIIFGSSFPKDQEYTQICRNINRVKICMETGQMVILLNLQSLYESLYDALNQYYVYLAGQKYIDLGLGTHRVKCRVHPKFKLIVVEEKEIVYKDFPTPLINRLEKHYLDINTFLKEEHKFILNELEAWVKDFTKGDTDNTMGKTQTNRLSEVFIGFHSDTCASVVLQVTENMKISHPDTETYTVVTKAKHVLLNCATPDSVIRFGTEDLIDEYFKKQKHGSLLDLLCYHVISGNENHIILTEITTFSRLLTSADKKNLEAELSGQINSIEILSLQQIDTELSFLKQIWSFLNSSCGNLVLIIQSDVEEGPQGANLVASAKYAAMNEIHKMNLTDVSIFVYFVTKLSRMAEGSSYAGFRGGLWQSVHIDDLRKSKDMVADITALQNLPISQLFYTEGEPARGGDVGNSTDQELEANLNNVSSENILDTTILIRSCIQNAIALLRDDKTMISRSTKRIEILIKLLSEEDQIKGAFLQMLKRRLHSILKVKEENMYQAAEWVVREAANQDALHEAGTFRQTLWKRVQRAVTPVLCQILSVLDRNSNLDLLVDENVDDYLKSLWMLIFHDENVLPISSNSSQTETILVDNYLNICIFGKNSFPFSWRIKDFLENIWTQAGYIDHKEGSKMQFLDMFSQTPLGKFISSLEENKQNDMFLYYQRDFILMTMSISSEKELQVMEFALSSCIEELRSSQRTNELPLPWVHIGYNTFQHRLQNLSRILVINPSVLQHLIDKIEDSKQIRKNEMVLDIFAAIACLETLRHTVNTSDPWDWMQQVKNIQIPIELICSEEYLQGYSSWCKKGIRQIRSYWNCVFSMALFMEHLLVDVENDTMQEIIRAHALYLGRRLENFPEIKTEGPLMAVVDVLQKCRADAAKTVSRYEMQDCAICHDDLNEPVCLNCDHVFCLSCLKQWLDSHRICPMCKTQLPETFNLVVSTDISDAMNKYAHLRRQCNEFFVNFICHLCFKDNTPPDQKVIRCLLSFLFGTTEIGNHTRFLSPFDDVVDKTPVIRSVLLKLLLKYSFDAIVEYIKTYLAMLESSNLLKDEDTRELCLLFINSLEDSLFEKKHQFQSEIERSKYLEEECAFLETYVQNSKQQIQDEKSIYFFQDVARVKVALETAAEMLSMKSREVKNDHYLKCVMDLCSQCGNDWYRIYLIRKLANLDGIAAVQGLSKDPESKWLFPMERLQNEDTEASNLDQFLVCGDSYKVLREGIARGMIEGKEKWIKKAIEDCGCHDQQLSAYLLLAVFREITLYFGAKNNAQQLTTPEQESVKTFIKDVKVFTEGSLNIFLQTLLNNNRPCLQAVPGLTGVQVTIFELAIHMAAVLLTGNNHLFAPLKNLSFFPSRMQKSYLPTMPEDMFEHASAAIKERIKWYLCPNGHYCAVGECGQPMQTSQCLDCGVSVGGKDHLALKGFKVISQHCDRTQTGHVLGDPKHQGPTVAPDRDIAAPAFILLRLITHLAMLLGSEEDITNLVNIVKATVEDVRIFCLQHIERDLEFLKNSLGKSADDTTIVVHLIFQRMLNLQQHDYSSVPSDDIWSTKIMRNNWEKLFASNVIAPVLKNLERDLTTVNDYISQDKRVSSNLIVKLVYGDLLASGETIDLPQESIVHCSKTWSCRERISIEYILHVVQQQHEGSDNLHLLLKFLEKESELQMVKFLPDILKLQKDLVKKFQNYKDNSFKTIRDFLNSITPGGILYIYRKRIEDFMVAWNHLRFSLQTNGEITLPEGMCDEILTMDSDFEFLLPRRQGLGLGATALTSYLIALHNSFIHRLENYTNTEQKYSIKASEVMDTHVINYEKERDIVPIVLSNCQYILESGKETLQEFDFPKIQHQLIMRLFQGKPLITIVGLPTLTLSNERNYENLFTDVKKKLPQVCLSNSATDVISKDLNAFSDVCEALNIVDILLGFLATAGGDPELSLTRYIEDVLKMGEQSSEHILQALKRCCLKNTVALWQLLSALKSQHLLHLKRDPFANVDKAFKKKLDKSRQQALNMFLEQNGAKSFLLKLHEMIMLKLRKSRSSNEFKPSWPLKDVLVNLFDENEISLPELEKTFPEQIELAHCIETWKFAALKKWNHA